jgi:ubiquitin-conjugating enzyme E2 I
MKSSCLLVTCSRAMSSLLSARLAQERKDWRKDHPHGFIAKPLVQKDKNGDSVTDMTVWNCSIPGKAGTAWEGGVYPITLTFGKDYPAKPPRVAFPPGFFHPNVYPTGKVCLSILNEEKGWKPSVSIKQILVGVQELLDAPNLSDPAQQEAYDKLRRSKADYLRIVKEQAKKYGANAVGSDDVIVL